MDKHSNSDNQSQAQQQSQQSQQSQPAPKLTEPAPYGTVEKREGGGSNITRR